MAGPIDEAPVDVWRSQMAVNLDTAFHMTRAALRPMRDAGRGSIVYIGTSATRAAVPGRLRLHRREDGADAA